MRLLLAEDEKEMAHALEAVFTHNHYSVDVVYNGIDAADWAESGNYDGMILDTTEAEPAARGSKSNRTRRNNRPAAHGENRKERHPALLFRRFFVSLYGV